jgi:hypothetical protein
MAFWREFIHAEQEHNHAEPEYKHAEPEYKHTEQVYNHNERHRKIPEGLSYDSKKFQGILTQKI